MLRLALATMTAAAAATVLYLVPAWGSSPVLVGEVGPGFTIEVKNAAGKDQECRSNHERAPSLFGVWVSIREGARSGFGVSSRRRKRSLT